MLDQGTEGACVGFSWSHELAANPQAVKGVTDATARLLYAAAKVNDEWPGEDYEGSSVLGGAKAVKNLGYMTGYKWCFGLGDVIMALGYTGPVVLGVNWYSGMFRPDSSGILRVQGDVAGGHAILCNGVDIKRQVVRLHNSWGRDWGINGECFMPFADLERLLHEEGEACVATGRTKKVTI